MVGDIMQPTHLLFVLVVALLVLGPKRLPEVGRTLGAGIRDFRQAISGETPEPSRHEADQVSSAATATEQRHQPATATATDADTSWHNETIGPLTFDEPDDAPAADGADVVTATQAEPVDLYSLFDQPADAGASAEEELAGAQHETVESAGSAEPRTETTT